MLEIIRFPAIHEVEIAGYHMGTVWFPIRTHQSVARPALRSISIFNRPTAHPTAAGCSDPVPALSRRPARGISVSWKKPRENGSRRWNRWSRDPKNGRISDRKPKVNRNASKVQAQRFLTVHGTMKNLFAIPRHLMRARHYRRFRTEAFDMYQQVTCA